jgi:hypothetical protein
MRLIDTETNEAVEQVQLYLSPDEARRFVKEIEALLMNSEANEHFHLFSEDGGCELSCSVVTRAKLALTGYTAEERRAFGGWKPKS